MLFLAVLFLAVLFLIEGWARTAVDKVAVEDKNRRLRLPGEEVLVAGPPDLRAVSNFTFWVTQTQKPGGMATGRTRRLPPPPPPPPPPVLTGHASSLLPY